MKKQYNLFVTKAVASGNDFIIIDNKEGELDARELNYSDLAKELCERKHAIGADGLLVLEKSSKAVFKMRILNPDGSEVNMCGNGARCSALYAFQCGWGDVLTMETGAGILGAEVTDDNVKLKMSDPKDLKLDINLGVGNSMMTAHFINTGVEHVVHIVDSIEDYDVDIAGRSIREHTLFSPEGTNANFIGNIENNGASIRTYERGVEGETLACGTGTVASALILGILGHVESPVKMKTAGGEVLKVYFKLSGKKATDVYLEGSANIVFETKI